MNIQGLIQSFFPEQEIKINKLPQFKENDLFYGRVNKLYPNQLAELQIGPNRLVARLEVPLQVNEGYWLQVAQSKGEVQLRLVPQQKNTNHTEPLQPLLHHLSLENNEGNKQLARFLMNENIILPREEILQVEKMIRNVDDIPRALETIKSMISRQLPMNETVFQALHININEEPSIGILIRALQTQLESSQNLGANERNILQFIKNFEATISTVNSHTENDMPRLKEQILTQLQTNIERMGLSYESKIAHTEVEENLKALLVKYMQESTQGQPIKSIAEQIVLRMNHHQLQSFEQGPIQQIQYEIPLTLPNQSINLTTNWQGRRRADGTIDPDYCRIILYLDLKNMKQTIVEMQVQNRIMSVNIYTDGHVNEQHYSSIYQKLKDNLDTIDYKLSQVKINPEKQNKVLKKSTTTMNSDYSYQKVDFKI